jgi:hypothetical protein
MSYWWRSWDTDEQIAEYHREDEWWKEYLSHPENVERMRLAEIKSRRDRVGAEFYDTHTKSEVDKELDRLSWKFTEMIANTDITYLYKRPYPIQENK